MGKKVLVVLLVLAVCVCVVAWIPGLRSFFAVASCLRNEWDKEMASFHGDVTRAEDGALLYQGRKYYASDACFDKTITHEDVQIGWYHSLKGQITLYADSKNNPTHIASASGGFAYEVYVREDIDWKNGAYSVGDTDLEVRLSEVFHVIVEQEDTDWLNDYSVELRLKSAPALKIKAECYWRYGQWYCVRDGVYYGLSSDFTVKLLEKGYLNADTVQKPSGEELEGVNKLRVDYDLGDCRNLKGNVAMVLIFMDDFESSWTNQEMDIAQRNEINTVDSFLEREAERYNVPLDISVHAFGPVYYDGRVTNDDEVVSVDVMSQAAAGLGYGSASAMRRAMQVSLGVEEIIFITLFNKKGSSYGLNPRRGSEYDLNEHCVIFYDDLTSQVYYGGQYAGETVVSLLYLYGAESFWVSMWRSELAKSLCENDVVYNWTANIHKNNRIGDATAFYIGWIHVPPAVMYDENW